MISDQIQQLRQELENEKPSNRQELEDFRIRYMGKKGKLNACYALLKSAPNEEKKLLGQQINEFKQEVQQQLESFKSAVQREESKAEASAIDMSLPVDDLGKGSRHPLSLVRNELVRIFGNIGFDVSEGNEVVDEWTNFTALNMPEDHPARDMQDTFFVDGIDKHVLRTHTSGVQVKVMLDQSAPIRTIAPGMVFRKDNDSTHSPFFHQVEGLYIDKNVSFADLKQCLYYFVQEMFGEGTAFRLRPSYFPFTEPSAEMDIEWNKNEEKSWMEILGCGMVDPAVLENCNIDPEIYSGYAFGIGIERIAMLKYGIHDIRTFYENDQRFLSQFASE